MRSTRIRWSFVLPAVLLPICVFADSLDGGETTPRWENLLWSALPLVLFVALLYFVLIRRLRPAQKRSDEYLARQLEFTRRHEQHMERVEELLERLVAVLERKNKDGS